MTLGCRPLVSHALPAKAPSAWVAASPRPAPAACSEPAWGAPATAPARGHGLLVLMPGPACKQGISTEKPNYEGWKRPPRSPYPTAPSPPMSPTHPRPPQQHGRGFSARSGQKKIKKSFPWLFSSLVCEPPGDAGGGGGGAAAAGLPAPGARLHPRAPRAPAAAGREPSLQLCLVRAGMSPRAAESRQGH